MKMLNISEIIIVLFNFIVKLNKNVSCNDIGKKRDKKHKINNELKNLKENEKEKEDYKNIFFN